ncbi:hypothetical protein ACWKWU_13680 [Chitinophaga lutea]
MRKILKFLAIFLIVIVSVCIIVTLYFYISNKVFLGSQNRENTAYLMQHRAVVGDSISGELFDDGFYQSNVFLLGEIHGFAGNQQMDKTLFTFLNKKLGVRHYIAEMDSATARKFNTYLTNTPKDDNILREAVLDIRKRIPQQSSRELFDKWSALYDYNQQLHDSAKIVVIGIDKGFDDTDNSISRDSAMTVNFKHAIGAMGLENAKFYGLFGFFHTLQDTLASGRKPFAERLKSAGFRTTTLVSYTLESDMYLPKNPQFPTPPDEKVDWMNADGPLMLVKGINDLKATSAPHTITLFKLNGDQSPYLRSQQLIRVKSRMFGDNIEPTKAAVTTGYFQYVFLLRNGKALTKLQ